MVRSPLTAARATFALKAGEWFRRGRLLMVSPVHGDYRRYQAEIPLIALSKFPRPALNTGPGGPSAPTGKSTRTDYVYVMQFEGDKISHMTKIWNAGMALRELGWA